MAERQKLLEKKLLQWLGEMGLSTDFTLVAASADASFRRYFRFSIAKQSFVVMDAPPGHEDCRSFVAIAKALLQAGLHVPQVLKMDLQQGFLLLTDLGEQQYLQVLNAQTVEPLYADALRTLMLLQSTAVPRGLCPDYSFHLLHDEMELFLEWFVMAFLGLTMTLQEKRMIKGVFALLAQQALAQPQVWVHRDYHSRNLMWIAKDRQEDVAVEIGKLNPGVLDFQDAVTGPVCYDLVSLLRDCYISWPQQQVHNWLNDYHHQLLSAGIVAPSVSSDEFRRWFDWMGIQRHLKAVGIFSRLKIRDKKSGYLADIPRTLFYIMQASGDYQELMPLHDWLRASILPFAETALSIESGFFATEK